MTASAPTSSTALLHADEQRDAEEADADADQPRAASPAGDGSIRAASSTVKIGAAAWITRGEPGVEPRLREAEQPERKRVVERAEHEERHAAHRADVARPTRGDDERQQHQSADREAAEARPPTARAPRRPSLMNMNDEPQIADSSEQQREVAAGHRATLVAGATPRPAATRAVRRPAGRLTS